MGSTTGDPGPTTESEGTNQPNQGAAAADEGNGPVLKTGLQLRKVTKVIGVEVREDLDRNEERGSLLGKPKDLTAKLREGHDTKRDRRNEDRLKRKEAYSSERKKGVRKDTEMSEEALKPFVSVKVKQEQLDDSDLEKKSDKSRIVKEVEIVNITDEDKIVLEIDLTKDTKDAKKFKSKKLKKSKAKAAKTGSSIFTKKDDKKKDTKENKGSKAKPKPRKPKKISSAAQALIDLTKGIGKAKKAESEKKKGKKVEKVAGFDFGEKKKENVEVPLVVTPVKTKPAEAEQRVETGVEVVSTPTKPLNVYEGAAARAKAKSAATKQMVLGTRTKYKGSRRFRVTFTTKAKRSQKGGDYDMSLTQQSEELRQVLVNILARAKATCKRAAIHPWVGEKDKEMPTIVDIAHVPKTYGELRRYITHDDDQFKIQGVRAGSNGRWRVLINFDMSDTDHFLHLYQTSKGDWNEYPYIPLVDAPLQDEHYHCLGHLLDSSADQPTRVNEVGIEEKVGFAVGLSFGNMPMDRDYQNLKWEEARSEGGGGKRETFKNAPQSIGVYVNEKSLQARAVMAKTMAMEYGVMKDGMYPSFADGTRMRFIPNYKLVPFNKRVALEKYADLQCTLKKKAVVLDIGIKDPNQKIMGNEKIRGQTIGQLLLGLNAGKSKLPIFRHFVKRYSRRYNPHTWSVSVHPNMCETAADTLSQLKEIVTKQYGEEAGNMIFTSESYASKAGIKNSTFQPDESAFEYLDVSKDWYLAGNAKCMIEGMDVLKETPEQKEAMDSAIRSIDETKMTFLSNVNTAEEEKTVATSGSGVSFGDTASRLSYDSQKSAWAGHNSGEEDTVEVKQSTENTHGRTDTSEAMKIDKADEIEPGEPEVEDTTMSMPSGTNGAADSTGGSGTRAVVGEQPWIRQGTEADERSMFQWATTFGLKALNSTFSSPNKGYGTDGKASSTQQP